MDQRARRSAAAPKRTRKCQYCNQTFSRSDSLRRHYRTHDSHRTTATRRKSCRNCAKSKIRCSGEVPICSSCRKRSLSCSYGARSSPPTTETLQDASWSSTPAVASDLTTGQQLSNEAIQTCTAPTFSSSEPMQDWLTAAPGDKLNYLGDFNETSIFSNGGHIDMNWLFDPSALSSAQFLEDFDSSPSDPLLVDSHFDHVPSEQNTLPTAPNQATENLPPPSPKNNAESDNPWPLEWKAHANQPVALPDLDGEERVDVRHFDIEPMSETTWNKVSETVRLPLERGPWQPLVSANFPHRAYWDFFIDLYFARFDPLVSVLHRSTFSPNRVAVVVLIAVAAIGACYSGLEGRHRFACALWELNRRLLWFMSESDPRYIRTEYYMTAQLLQSIFAKNSGEKRLLELGESSRSQLVNNAGSMDLFQDSSSRWRGPLAMEERWRAWIKEESLCRLGWAIYIYDASVSFQLNKRPCVSLANIHLSLPNADEFWAAESAQSWDALYPSEPWAPKRTPFRPLITGLFDERPVASAHLYQYDVVMHTLARMLWTRMEMAASFKAYYSRTADDAEQGKTDLLRAFDLVKWSGPTDLLPGRGYLMRHWQMHHMAQLYAADDLMGWLFNRLRNSGPAARAEAELRDWARDVRRVRRIAFHSAQVLAIIRCFPENHPMEAFNAFYAGVALWYMAHLLREARPAQTQASAPVQLDLMGSDAANRNSLAHPQPQLDGWMKAELDAKTVGINGVADITSDAGPAQVHDYVTSILAKMPVWNIAQVFCKVFARLAKLF